MANMGFYDQPEWSGFPNICFKRKHRWKFMIKGVSSDGIGSLPPARLGRLGLSFKEMSAEHLNETIYFPSKPEWKPISLTLYDIKKESENPVFTWIRRQYDPKDCSYWKPSLQSPSFKCAECFLVLYDGCGQEMERYVFEHAWPQSADFFEGDMQSADVIYCDITLRYDRAYVVGSDATIDFNTVLPSYTCSATPAVSMALFQAIQSPEFIQIRD